MPVAQTDSPPTQPAAVAAFAPYAHWQGSADAYVSVPHDDALNPKTGATFEAWIFPSNLGGCRAIFGKNYQQGYWVGLCNGRIRYHSAGTPPIRMAPPPFCPTSGPHRRGAGIRR